MLVHWLLAPRSSLFGAVAGLTMVPGLIMLEAWSLLALVVLIFVCGDLLLRTEVLVNLIRKFEKKNTGLHIHLGGRITPELATDFIATVQEQPTAKLLITISSTGGDAAAGHAIIEAIRKHLGQVNVVIAGPCFSAAFLVACAAPAENRYILPGSRVMIHGSKCYGTTEDEPAPTIAGSYRWINNLTSMETGTPNTSRLNAWQAWHIAGATPLDAEQLLEGMNSQKELWYNTKKSVREGLALPLTWRRLARIMAA